ncbi:MAG: GNAT family N-acetyltransferase [Bacteroidales bacterium]|jgi:dTDP-4-amino-4,6-dideoxy-D-galactose acyltransferase|nr:GNAT family N-acetyltransferase [Bacteroidales bacterium]
MIDYLKWDSIFFNKKIGKVIITSENQDISEILKKAKNDSFELLYVFLDEQKKNLHGKLIENKAQFMPPKITYAISLNCAEDFSSCIFGYNLSIVTPELRELAYESGIYSRFKVDSNFENADFYRLYFHWIQESISGKIADKVYVAKENNKIVGMCTLSFKEKANIGLIATSKEHQGKGYGKALINKCKYEAKKRTISELTVSTQATNINACNFYENCGFRQHSKINIYHIWL